MCRVLVLCLCRDFLAFSAHIRKAKKEQFENQNNVEKFREKIRNYANFRQMCRICARKSKNGLFDMCCAFRVLAKNSQKYVYMCCAVFVPDIAGTCPTLVPTGTHLVPTWTFFHFLVSKFPKI